MMVTKSVTHKQNGLSISLRGEADVNDVRAEREATNNAKRKSMVLGAAFAAALAVVPVASRAESTTYGMGGMSVINSINDSRSAVGGLMEMVPLGKNSASSFGYINEGTKRDSNRSGLFANFMLTHNITENIQTFMGVGPYVTYTTPVTGSGKGGSYHLNLDIAFGATMKLTPNIHVMVEWMQVKTGIPLVTKSRNTDVDNVMFGVGVSGLMSKGSHNGDDPSFSGNGNTTINFLGGESAYSYASAPAWELVQTVGHDKGKYLAAFGYMNEGHKSIDGMDNKRDGVFAEIWRKFKITNGMDAFVSAGPYLSSTTEVTGPTTYSDVYHLNLETGVGFVGHITKHLDLLARFEYIYGGRTFGGQSTNSKMFLFGVGYRD